MTRASTIFYFSSNPLAPTNNLPRNPGFLAKSRKYRKTGDLPRADFHARPGHFSDTSGHLRRDDAR